jgi:hypothetical protein
MQFDGGAQVLVPPRRSEDYFRDIGIGQDTSPVFHDYLRMLLGISSSSQDEATPDSAVMTSYSSAKVR